jgi:zinc/manganese transport system permease protein
MENFWNIMLAPFVECLILVGLHSYLGIHVLKRHVIFVDLSLAQIAALGTSVGILFGIYDTESPASFIFALSFTVMGAAIFAMSRFEDKRIPQEAIIGLVYAITAAVAVLVVQKTKGVEHLVNIMHGRLLWVRWTEVATAAVAYAVLGGVHWVFRKQFLQISEDPDEAYRKGMNVRLWDFFFYVTFGFTISISVKVAGVLLVFVFLVAPAIIALLLSRTLRTQMLIGWGSGFLVTVMGLSWSWWADMPSGPTVVTFYGIVLLLVAVVVWLVRAEQRRKAFTQLAGGLVAVAAIIALFWLGGGLLANSSLANVEDEVTFGDLGAATHSHFHGHGDEMLAHAGHEGHQHEHLHGEGVEAEHGAPPQTVSFQERFAHAEIPLDCLDVIGEALVEEKLTGLQLLHEFMSDPETPPFCRSSARDLLVEHAEQDFGYDPDADDNTAALSALGSWLEEQGEG